MRSYASREDLLAEKRLFGPKPWLLQPGYWAVRTYRFGRSTMSTSGITGRIRHAVYFVLYSLVRLQTGIDLPRSAEIGGRLMIHHFGTIIVHPQARLGSDCVLRHGVTIGERRPGDGVPTIGDRVVFGAHVQVLGRVFVGDDAILGASAVVLKDVRPGSTVAGVPAREVR